MKEGGVHQAHTFQQLPLPSSLFSPVPTISQTALDPALSDSSQSPLQARPPMTEITV